MMDFSDALRVLKAKGRVARAGWNGRGMWLVLIPGDRLALYGAPFPEDIMESDWLPFIAMRPVGGGLVPWLASQTDILADDWEEVSEGPST